MRIGLALRNPRLIHTIERALVFGGHQLVWSTGSATEALRRLTSDCPDVVLIGVDLGEMTAAELTRRLLAPGRTLVMLVAERSDAAIAAIYEAMGAGALDVVALPEQASTATASELVLAKLRTASRILTGSSANLRVEDLAEAVSMRAATPPLIALGASTGGPQALVTILSAFPANTRSAILIVQHVDEEFSQGLASWLAEASGLKVEVARQGGSPVAGTVHLAGTKDHLVITAGGSFRYIREPRDLPYRPSVDVLFDSLAQHWRGRAAAALLTGMGRDGARGLANLKKAGWLTMAQDEASCVVYGMPKAAAQLGAAMKILAPKDIAAELAGFVE